MAVLLSLALPGLGSIYQRHVVWGSALLGLGTALFLGSLDRILMRLRAALAGEIVDLGGLLLEAAAGIGLILVTYAVDLAAVWSRRGRLVPHDR